MLEDILASKSKISILRLLIGNSKRGYSFQDISKLTGISYGTVHPALTSLIKTRIIITEKVGRSLVYRANTRHPLFEIIEQLFENEKNSFILISRKMVNKLNKSGIKTILLFGSAARGEGSLKSDIDILIFHFKPRKMIENNINEAIRGVSKEYDVVITPTYLEVNEAKERKRNFDRFILSAQEEGKILYGDLGWLER